MDGPRFDAWTRRRVGLVAGGVFASFLPIWAAHDAAAKKKKKRKKRCRKLGKACKSGSKRKKCCKNLLCRTTEASVGNKTFCCRNEGQSCQTDTDCCGELALGCAPDNTCQKMAISDRALKANVGSVDGRDMLARVRQLPITTWNYTSDEATIRHIGPMAQDFAATFGVGANDRHIHPIDGQGVALAAIQGLITEMDALRAENARLAARLTAVERGSPAR